MIRARFHFRETGSSGDLTGVIEGISRRGTQGIILKAPDASEVNESVARLAGRGIPVVTLVTDLPHSARTAYVGIDNRAAGATAAYLITQWLGDRPGALLVTLSRSFFRGEEEREMGFRSALRSMQPGRRVIEVTDTDGLDATIRGLVAAALGAEGAVPAVYSAGGGNTAILGAFADCGRPAPLLIAQRSRSSRRTTSRKARPAGASPRRERRPRWESWPWRARRPWVEEPATARPGHRRAVAAG